MFPTLGSFLGHTKLLALAGVTAASLAVAPTAVRAIQGNHNPDATRPDNGDPNANFDNGQNNADPRNDGDHANFNLTFSRQSGDRRGFSPYGNPASNNDRPDFRRQDPRDSRRSDDCGPQRYHPLANNHSEDHFSCNITFTRSHHHA